MCVAAPSRRCSLLRSEGFQPAAAGITAATPVLPAPATDITEQDGSCVAVLELRQRPRPTETMRAIPRVLLDATEFGALLGTSR